MTIYMFWFGDENQRSNLLKKIKELNEIVAPKHQFVLGPTETEHEFLLNSFEYYKKCMKNKKYALMADVYRTWKLSENTGLYMDALMNINKHKIKTYLDQLELTNKSFFIKEDKYYINPCLFCITNSKAQLVLKDVLNRYKKYKNIKNINQIELGPLQFTQSLKNLNLFIKGYDFSENELFQFLPLTFIDKLNFENIFYYSFQASWKKNNKKNEKKWKKAFQNYYHHKHKSFLVGLYGYLFWKNRFFLKILLFFYNYNSYAKLKSLEIK